MIVSEVERRLWAAAVEWMHDWPGALLGTARAMQDGTWWGTSSPGRCEMGDVLGKFAELRREVGVLKAKKKDGVRFKVRSADELADRIRPVADQLGLLIYPVRVEAKGHVVENGTLAEATVTLRVQAISDESYFDIVGFGLGADNQDKAGGKAGTYAWKTALVQALTAGGEKDTDDTDTPIVGGVKPARGPAAADASAAPRISETDVEILIAEAVVMKDVEKLKRAIQTARVLPEAVQTALAVKFKAARTEIQGAG